MKWLHISSIIWDTLRHLRAVWYIKVTNKVDFLINQTLIEGSECLPLAWIFWSFRRLVIKGVEFRWQNWWNYIVTREKRTFCRKQWAMTWHEAVRGTLLCSSHRGMGMSKGVGNVPVENTLNPAQVLDRVIRRRRHGEHFRNVKAWILVSGFGGRPQTLLCKLAKQSTGTAIIYETRPWSSLGSLGASQCPQKMSYFVSTPNFMQKFTLYEKFKSFPPTLLPDWAGPFLLSSTQMSFHLEGSWALAGQVCSPVWGYLLSPPWVSGQKSGTVLLFTLTHSPCPRRPRAELTSQ